MTKRQDFCLQRRSRPEQSDQRQPNQAANIPHQPRASPDSTSLASRIEFPTMTADRFKVRGIDFNLRRSLVFERDTGINDGLRLRRRVAPESTRSTHRVTSPFPGSLPLKTLHIHRPADLPDVYAVIELDSRPYDAIFDVFPVLQPVPAELHALRLLLACSGRLF